MSHHTLRRNPVASGSFYPGDEEELRREVDALLRRASLPADLGGKLLALVVPHAGYPYSGAVAACGYRALEHTPPLTAVIAGPYHRFAFHGIAVYPEGKWMTPLGEVEVDEEIASRLLSQGEPFRRAPELHEGEHSIEVQLPFLQRVAPKARIVPLSVGGHSLELIERAGDILADLLLSQEATVFIASSDLYHGYSYKQCLASDDRTISLALEMDEGAFFDALSEGAAEACGGIPMAIAMRAARKAGARKALLLSRTNSAEVTGSTSGYVVGYSSIAYLKEE